MKEQGVLHSTPEKKISLKTVIFKWNVVSHFNSMNNFVYESGRENEKGLILD